jgi:mandelate racemase
METMNPNAAGMRPVKLRSLTSRGVLVPLSFTLGTSAAIVRTVPLLLVDLATDDGTTGHAYAFCYRPSGAARSPHIWRKPSICWQAVR